MLQLAWSKNDVIQISAQPAPDVPAASFLRNVPGSDIASSDASADHLQAQASSVIGSRHSGTRLTQMAGIHAVNHVHALA